MMNVLKIDKIRAEEDLVQFRQQADHECHNLRRQLQDAIEDNRALAAQNQSLQNEIAN
jgi:hypothetical protein